MNYLKLISILGSVLLSGCGTRVFDQSSALNGEDTTFVLGQEVKFHGRDLDAIFRSAQGDDRSHSAGSYDNLNGSWNWTVNVGPGQRCGVPGYGGISAPMAGSAGSDGPLFFAKDCGDRNRQRTMLMVNKPMLWSDGFNALRQSAEKIQIRATLKYAAQARHRSGYYGSELGGIASNYLVRGHLDVSCPGHPHSQGKSISTGVLTREFGNRTDYQYDTLVLDGDIERTGGLAQRGAARVLVERRVDGDDAARCVVSGF